MMSLSYQSASSTTLVTQTEIQLKPTNVSSNRPSFSPPPTRMSANGFIEPHHSNLPRRRTVKKTPAPLPLPLDQDTPTTPNASTPMTSGTLPPTATTTATSNADAEPIASPQPTPTTPPTIPAQETTTPEPTTPPDTQPQPQPQRRNPSSLPFHTRYDRDKSKDLDHDLSFDLSTCLLPPTTPASGPSRANTPRRRNTRASAKAHPAAAAAGAPVPVRARGRHHVRKYVLDGPASSAASPARVPLLRSSDTEEEEEEGGDGPDGDWKDEGSAAAGPMRDPRARANPNQAQTEQQQDPRHPQLLRGGNVELLISLSTSSTSSSTQLSYDLCVEDPVVRIETSATSVLELSLPGETLPSDLVDGTPHLTYEQYLEASKFVLSCSESARPNPFRVLALQKCRKEEAFAIALAFLSCCDRVASRKKDQPPTSTLISTFPTTTSSTGPTTHRPSAPFSSSSSSPLSRPNTLPTPTEVESLLEVDVLSSTPPDAGLATTPTTSTPTNALPVPDVYTYSRTHHLLFRWTDVGCWKPRVGPLFTIPTPSPSESPSPSVSPSPSASSSSAESTSDEDDKEQKWTTSLIRDLTKMGSVEGLVDEWRGLLSYDGLEMVEGVVVRLGLELGKEFERFVLETSGA